MDGCTWFVLWLEAQEGVWLKEFFISSGRDAINREYYKLILDKLVRDLEAQWARYNKNTP